MTTALPDSPGRLLARGLDGPVEAAPHLWGFGGLHGGLTLALLTSAMRRSVPADAELRTVTARFHRSLTGRFDVEAAVLRPGTVTTLTARAVQADSGPGPEADATATFAPRRPARTAPVSPAPPVAPPPQDCELFTIPPEFVPISTFMEIRPVGPNRPYSGCAEPELTAWIRFTEDDLPPDTDRFLTLIDALAPSYAAVLTDLRLVPTLELTVRPTPGLAHASSPWILLRARTHRADAGGWVDEHIDAWDGAGTHLGSAYQLRLVRPSADN
ncbi:thioesterase family protein [Streptomyces ureilyticus]|uniref:thioesterase family protein n=1 Tax=Streptomyces ureilyticus TaxID=1775131 RepID=UPI001F472012|nr:thioesterase family protein [Streptomyces ureilyticus]